MSRGTRICKIYLNSLNFRAHLIFAQSHCAKKWLREIIIFFAHFTALKLNVREKFLLKRGAKIRLRETGKRGKRVKHIFLPWYNFSLTATTKKNIKSSLITVTLPFVVLTILSCNIMFMKDTIKCCMKPWFSMYPSRGGRKKNVREIVVRENWMRENKMREIWSWVKIKWIKVVTVETYLIVLR